MSLSTPEKITGRYRNGTGQKEDKKISNSPNGRPKVRMPNGSQIYAPGKGKGLVPPGERDAKRVVSKSEKQEMLNDGVRNVKDAINRPRQTMFRDIISKGTLMEVVRSRRIQLTSVKIATYLFIKMINSNANS